MAISDDTILAIMAKLNTAVESLISGANSPQDLITFKELGPAGFSYDPANTLDALRRLLEYYGELLANPAARGDLYFDVSILDNLDI